MLALTFETFRQLTVDGFFRGCGFGLLGVGFALILGVTGRFHFAYGFTYTLAAYLAFTFTFRVDWPFWPSAVLGVLLVGRRRRADRGPGVPAAGRQRRADGTARRVRRLARHRHRRREPDPAALGLGDAGVLRPDEEGVHACGTSRSSTSTCGRRPAPSSSRWPSPPCSGTRHSGRRIKATRVNPDLARTIGIDADRTYVIVFFLGTICGGVAAFWYALKFTVDPAMGTLPVIYAFVVAFLGGTARSPIRVFLMGIVVALIEQYASIWLSVQ